MSKEVSDGREGREVRRIERGRERKGKMIL